MRIIKSIPCGHLVLEACRSDTEEVLVQLKEILPGGEEGRKIVCSHLSADEIRRAESYVTGSPWKRSPEQVVSDVDGVSVVILAPDPDCSVSDFGLQFERKGEGSRLQWIVTLKQKTLSDFLKRLIHALCYATARSTY